jgi:hypothetical protein
MQLHANRLDLADPWICIGEDLFFAAFDVQFEHIDSVEPEIPDDVSDSHRPDGSSGGLRTTPACNALRVFGFSQPKAPCAVTGVCERNHSAFCPERSTESMDICKASRVLDQQIKILLPRLDSNYFSLGIPGCKEYGRETRVRARIHYDPRRHAKFPFIFPFPENIIEYGDVSGSQPHRKTSRGTRDGNADLPPYSPRPYDAKHKEGQAEGGAETSVVRAGIGGIEVTAKP